MKKILAILLGLCMLQGAMALAEDEAQSPAGELEVRGQAVRMVAPDTVTISLGASIEDESEKVAQEQANTIINDVIEALRALGVEEQQMSTSGYDITRQYSYIGRKSIATGYIARISLRVTVRDFDLINQILDVAVDHGANDVGNIAFSFFDESEVYREALADAILAAKAKAQIMAETAGVELSTLLALREGSSGGAYYNSYTPAMAMEEGASGGAQIMSGEVEISASVTLVYETK